MKKKAGYPALPGMALESVITSILDGAIFSAGTLMPALWGPRSRHARPHGRHLAAPRRLSHGVRKIAPPLRPTRNPPDTAPLIFPGHILIVCPLRRESLIAIDERQRNGMGGACVNASAASRALA